MVVPDRQHPRDTPTVASDISGDINILHLGICDSGL